MLGVIRHKSFDVLYPKKVVPELRLPLMDYHAPRQSNKESSQKGYPANPEKFLPPAFPDHKRHNRQYWYRKSKESLGKERETAEDSENH
jgi:hypothetical protein